VRAAIVDAASSGLENARRVVVTAIVARGSAGPRAPGSGPGWIPSSTARAPAVGRRRRRAVRSSADAPWTPRAAEWVAATAPPRPAARRRRSARVAGVDLESTDARRGAARARCRPPRASRGRTDGRTTDVTSRRRRGDGRDDDDGRDGDGDGREMREMREMRDARVDVVRRDSTRARDDDAGDDDDDDDDARDDDDDDARGDSRLSLARARERGRLARGDAREARDDRDAGAATVEGDGGGDDDDDDARGVVAGEAETTPDSEGGAAIGAGGFGRQRVVGGDLEWDRVRDVLVGDV